MPTKPPHGTGIFLAVLLGAAIYATLALWIYRP
jgi:hypothetical protein